MQRLHAFLEAAIPRWAYSSPGSRPHQGLCPWEIRPRMRTSDASPFDALLQQVRAAYTDRPTSDSRRHKPSGGLDWSLWLGWPCLTRSWRRTFWPAPAMACSCDGNRRWAALSGRRRQVPGTRQECRHSRVVYRYLSGAACASLARVIRFAGWLPRDTTRFRSPHDAVKALQAARASPIALRDVLTTSNARRNRYPARRLWRSCARTSSCCTISWRRRGRMVPSNSRTTRPTPRGRAADLA